MGNISMADFIHNGYFYCSGVVALAEIQLPSLAGLDIRGTIHFYNYSNAFDMNTRLKTYQVIKQIHLYSTLVTLAFLLMYIITSYMMIYHDQFKMEETEHPAVVIPTSGEEINSQYWESLISKHKIDGRLVRDNVNSDGELVRIYSGAKKESKITYYKDRKEIKIQTSSMNMSGSIIGLHRLRGYGGPFIYNFYAVMLDIVGISLILFAVTGVILWLKLLKFNKMAWVILIFGFLYVGAVITYLCLN